MEQWRRELANQAANAKLFEGGNFFTDGNYSSLIIDKLIMKKGQKGTCFVGEFLVEQSSPDASAPAGIQPNAPGTRASVVYNVTKHEAAMSNIKAIALAAAGYTEQQLIADQAAENAAAAAAQPPREAISILAEWILRATNENEQVGTVQPLRGKRLAGSTYRKGTQTQLAQGKPREAWNCYIKFRPVEGQTKQTVADGRQKLVAMEVAAPPAAAAPPPPVAPPAAQFGAPPAVTTSPAVIDGVPMTGGSVPPSPPVAPPALAQTAVPPTPAAPLAQPVAPAAPSSPPAPAPSPAPAVPATGMLAGLGM